MTYGAQDIPSNQPVQKLFRSVADRALTQSSIPDKDLLLYLSDMLTHFMYVDNLYPLKDENGEGLCYLAEMLEVALEAPRSRKKEFYQQIGDHTLFILGMFPESLTYGRRTLSHSYYADTGRSSYRVVSQMEPDSKSTVVFKKLADKYDRCVLSINWVREYTNDPFYQYMLRQFGMTQ